MDFLSQIILITYLTACFLLMLYGLNCHVMIHLFKRRFNQRKRDDQKVLEDFRAHGDPQRLPFITTQIPIYNELNVAERIIDAVVLFDYPPDRHEIQVLDDSTDETRKIVAKKIKALKDRGVCIRHIIRPDRKGFKAGALKYGMERARGELITIFDADFVPPRDFLLKSVPFFVMDHGLGLVQARWTHLNADKSLITKLQSIGINGHFMVEQSARNWNGLMMNFNGTAGVLRKKAIEDAGNWQEDTLTEDMDLSYRMQLAGWRCRYVLDLVAPAEIPEDINAFKNQQFRWAKGSIQTAIKLLPLVWRSSFSGFCKVQATLHMTHYLIHPLMAYLALLSPILLFATEVEISASAFIALIIALIIASTGPSRLYFVAERRTGDGWAKRLLYLPLLIPFGCGLAISNTRAVMEAVFCKNSEFIRTPKQGSKLKKFYRPPINALFLIEILIGLWCLSGILFYTKANLHLLRPFLFLYAIGFIWVGLLSIMHGKR
jgi:cellulose synthase/poly-beta-1,6-N-acetylglucosamine synthase-like glycosyltransferase